MNIKILDSWLREYLKTEATVHQIAEKLSLTSVSIERIEKYKNDDFLYDIEITTNRPDLASVVGLARETAAVLAQSNIQAAFVPPKLQTPKRKMEHPINLIIKNDDKLVKRVCAVVIDVMVKDTPEYIKERLESSGIRSLNNIIDITNYVMRTIGHPTHVFDFDRLHSKKIIIRESKKGEKIITLDKKEYVLPGGDIVAENDKGEIVDLLGIMGLENSVVTKNTKRILFFIDNNDPARMRKTSMSLAIRTEAVQLNEKGIDPEIAHEALIYGMQLYQQIANGIQLSEIIDIYPQKEREKKIIVSDEKINAIIGVSLPLTKSANILKSLGCKVTIHTNKLIVTPPSFRLNDLQIPEDIIEEIARVYGYHNIPSQLPSLQISATNFFERDEFFWEKRAKEALKYWGFTEVYSYSMVSEKLYEGPPDEAVMLQNPLTEEWIYMRTTLAPSLLEVAKENKNYTALKIFEIANVYIKQGNDLPKQIKMFAGVVKKPAISFYEVKGIIEQLFTDLGIKHYQWKKSVKGGSGASVYIQKEYSGEIEILSDDLINFELNFEIVRKHASLKKTYTQISKFPPIIEDISVIIDEEILTGDIIDVIKEQSPLIVTVSLLDKYHDTRTFHILYQHKEKNLTNEEVTEIRNKIIKSLREKYNAKIKN